VLIKTRPKFCKYWGQGSLQKKPVRQLVSVKTAARNIMNRYFAGGLKCALWDASRPGQARVFKGRKEQRLIAMLCGPSPLGCARWTIRLAADEAVARGIVPTAGRETVRVVMNNHALKPWREKNVVRSGVNAGVRGKDGGCS